MDTQESERVTPEQIQAERQKLQAEMDKKMQSIKAKLDECYRVRRPLYELIELYNARSAELQSLEKFRDRLSGMAIDLKKAVRSGVKSGAVDSMIYLQRSQPHLCICQIFIDDCSEFHSELNRELLDLAGKIRSYAGENGLALEIPPHIS